ncbi:MAG: response regulator [Thermoplasmatales archaeon]|nr:MAG: response regulator [Thermoplasmatales archaeon]
MKMDEMREDSIEQIDRESNKKNKTILIVDDQEDDLKSMNQILENEGYSVLACNDVTEALEALGRNDVDLILMDIIMPTLSGYDLLRLFREKLAREIPIVFVSVKPEIEVDTTNVADFIQKPFSPSTLVSKVDAVIWKNVGENIENNIGCR